MTAIDAAVILFGLVIGSFLNVCIHRIPRGESVVLPSSRCPSCKNRIRPWHNIPLFSYLLLRGRCAHCKERISPVYPAVEVLTALLFESAFLKYGWTAPFAIACVFFSLLIVLNFIDLFERLLPDVLTLSGTLMGLLCAPLQSAEFFRADPFLPEPSVWWMACLHSVAGILLGGGVLWLVAAVYLKLRKIEGMGFGDIKMMCMVGAFMGWRYAWLTIFVGSLLGAVIGSLYIYLRGKGQRYELPFGTFLAVGAVLVALWGVKLLESYLKLL